VKVFSGKDTDTEQKYPMEMFEEQQKTFDNLISLIEDKVEGILCNGISPSFSQSFKQQNPIQKESEKQFQKVLVENNLKEKLTKQTQYIKPNNPNVITNNNKPKIFLQVIGHEK
ncbi:hypothetical protein, partial [Candidatus Albibeggiatoa sp. nov. BB20]|uniref:hypothetical protein n=1 Tax=Candidatus Albibeggiatoa sp. nov. BB20 TaxID=3162723 RepID=UPI0033655E46